MNNACHKVVPDYRTIDRSGSSNDVDPVAETTVV